MKKHFSYGGMGYVNRQLHVVHDVSVIQEGPALGHKLFIDRGTLEDVFRLGNLSPERGVKCRFTHPGLSSDGLGRFLGRIRNFRLGNGRVIADLHLSNVAAKSPYGDLRDYIESLAEADPFSLGMSIVYRPAESHDEAGRSYARLLELLAVDVVDEPAANRDGLFSSALVGSNIFAERAFAVADSLVTLETVELAIESGDWSVLPSEILELARSYGYFRLEDVARCYVLCRRKKKMTQQLIEPDVPSDDGVALDNVGAWADENSLEISILRAELEARKQTEVTLLQRLRDVEIAERDRELRFMAASWSGDINAHLSVLKQLDSGGVRLYKMLMDGLSEQISQSALFSVSGTSRQPTGSGLERLDVLARRYAVEHNVTYEMAYMAVLRENPDLYSGGV